MVLLRLARNSALPLDRPMGGRGKVASRAAALLALLAALPAQQPKEAEHQVAPKGLEATTLKPGQTSLPGELCRQMTWATSCRLDLTRIELLGGEDGVVGADTIKAWILKVDANPDALHDLAEAVIARDSGAAATVRRFRYYLYDTPELKALAYYNSADQPDVVDVFAPGARFRYTPNDGVILLLQPRATCDFFDLQEACMPLLTGRFASLLEFSEVSQSAGANRQSYTGSHTLNQDYKLRLVSKANAVTAALLHDGQDRLAMSATFSYWNTGVDPRALRKVTRLTIAPSAATNIARVFLEIAELGPAMPAHGTLQLVHGERVVAYRQGSNESEYLGGRGGGKWPKEVLALTREAPNPKPLWITAKQEAKSAPR